MTSDQSYTGGCQCGAIRFRVASLGRASVCHCRMCQKATGGIAGVFVTVAAFDVTRGALKHFRSSSKVRRGFCADCGTPLTFEIDRTETAGGGIGMSIAAFDRAAEIAPMIQLARDTRLPWVDNLPALPERSPAETAGIAAHYAGIVSHQHPDHDTETWPLQ